MKKQYLLLCFLCLFGRDAIIAAPAPKPFVKDSIVFLSDYMKREAKIHSCIFNMFPGTYVDSLVIVNHLLNDSIRNKIKKERKKDSVIYLKTCLNNELKDSITLSFLAKLSSPLEQQKYNPTGAWIIHIKDVVTSSPLDSVIMNVFFGNTVVASGISNSRGNICARGIPEGRYYAIFLRRGYMPFSLKNVSVPNGRQLYIDIQLNKPENYFFQLKTENSWFFIAGGAGILLFLFGISILLLIKYRKGKKAAK